MWHRQAAAKRKAGWFIRRAAPDTASHSPVPPAFMEGLPDGSDSTIRAMAEPRQFLLHCLITLHARAESQWLWQPHQHNNNNSIVMNDCVFWSRGGNKVMPGHNATWKLNKDYYLKFTTFSYRFRESCWRSRSFEGWILSWQFFYYLPTLLKIRCFGSSSDAIEEPFWFHKETFTKVKVFLFIIWRTFFHHKDPFVKQKGSSDVKDSLWNLGKKLFYGITKPFIFKSVFIYLKKTLGTIKPLLKACFLNIRLIQLCRYNEDNILVVAVILGKKRQTQTKERNTIHTFTIRVRKKFRNKLFLFSKEGHI